MSGDTEAVANAISDLAQRLSVAPDEVSLVEAKAVTWPNGSLGCPQEGQVYTQALVEGFQVLVSHGDRIYDYRANELGDVRLCPSDEKDGGRDFIPPPGAGGS